MTPITAFIVDDEPDAGLLLKKLLNDFSWFEVKQVFTEANQALDALIYEKPDVLFLDIEMPELSGMQMQEQIKTYSPETKVVFVSAYKNYALEALQNSAFDFICKPVSKSEIQRVARKLLAASNRNTVSDLPESQKPVLLKTTEGHHYLNQENILFLEADGNYTYIHLNDDRKLLSSQNLGRIKDQLSPNQFLRINRKHVINKNYLSFVNFCKKYCLISVNSSEYKLEISTKMKDFKKELG
jgi:DNA-binding LytR/AlgR family response regulator